MTVEAFSNVRPVIHLNSESDDNLNESLISMVVNLPLNGMAHAEIHFSNWGVSEGDQEPAFLFGEIAFGDELDIHVMDNLNEQVLLFTGEITGIEECFGDGAPQLVLLLQDKLHHLARSRKSRAFESQSPDQIINSIASEFGLGCDANISSVTSTYHQINESDLAFLYRLLGRFDIALRLDGDSIRARTEETDPETIQLSPEDNVLRLRLLADLNQQPNQSKVQGYNPETGESVDGTVSSLVTPPGGTTAVDILNQLGWSSEEVIPQRFARSQGEADDYAKGHFQRQAKRFIHGDIHCMGDGALRSGREVQLEGVSERLKGKYQIVHAVHRFSGDTGYETHLKVNRASWGGT